MRRGCRRRYVSVHRRRRQVPPRVRRPLDPPPLPRRHRPVGAQVHHHARRRAPSPRSGASATAVGRKVYVFGGQCPERGTCFNDVVVLDCRSWEWSRLPVSGASPPPRNAHVASARRGTDASSSFTAVRAPRRAPWATSTFSTSKKAPSDGFDPPSADKPLRRERCTPPPPSPRPARASSRRTSHPRRPRQIRRPQRRRRLEPRRHGVDASRSSRARRLRAHRRAVARGDRGGRRRRERRARLRRVRRRGVAARTNSSPWRRPRSPPSPSTPGMDADQGAGWGNRPGKSPVPIAGARRRGDSRTRASRCRGRRRRRDGGDFRGVTPGADLADARAWSEERDGPAPAPASDLD